MTYEDRQTSYGDAPVGPVRGPECTDETCERMHEVVGDRHFHAADETITFVPMACCGTASGLCDWHREALANIRPSGFQSAVPQQVLREAEHRYLYDALFHAKANLAASIVGLSTSAQRLDAHDTSMARHAACVALVLAERQ